MPQELWDIWEAGDFTGPNRPYARVTVQKALLRPAHTMRTMLVQDQPQVEIPQVNLKMLTIDRKLGVDAAQMTLVIKNALPVDPTQNLDLSDGGLALPSTDFRTVRQLRELGHPGWYTFRRGVNATNQIGWGYASSPIWIDMFIPNRVIRTWQGYGTDGAVNPWEDTRLIQTGTWLIDRVEMNTKGDMTIQCRDYMKLAIEQRLYPPVIPLEDYPPEFCADHFEDVAVDPNDPASVNVASQAPGGGYKSSADVAFGTSPGGSNSSIYGHTAAHAFDTDWTSYWLSLGHEEPASASSYEWIEMYIGNNPVNYVQFHPKYGGYKVYISVQVGETWLGDQTIPYSPGQWQNGSAIPYVWSMNVPVGEEWAFTSLPERYNAFKIRLTFTNLAHFATDDSYRAAIYSVEAFDHPFFEGEGEPTTTQEFVLGNTDDYVDIIKVLAGWAGFYWQGGQPADPALNEWGTPEGRIWGDFVNSGAYPVDPPCIPPSFWDNKSVMDGINQIKEILGYIVYVDPTGGMICRMPNIWRTGNYVLGTGFVGSDSIHVFDEKKVIIDYGASIDDENLRSQIIVVSSSDRTLHTALTPGWSAELNIPGTLISDTALLGGQERVMLVPNYPFVAQAEVDKFAYLISLWLHWSFRRGKVRIPGNPAYGPDDQALIYERITHEQFIHYIEGVSSTMDFQTGTWYMDMDTHWLGEGPDRVWLVNTYEDMPPALYAYLKATGEIDSGSTIPGPPIFELPPNATTDIWDRVDDDFSNLFPGLPSISDLSQGMSDEEIAALIGTGYVTPPSTGSSGTVYSRSEQFYRTHWGPPGSNLTTITFMTKWQSLYDNPPVGYPVPANTHEDQLSTVSLTVHSLAAGAFRLMGEIFADHLYNVAASQTGAYNFRTIAGTNVLSTHAWGLAVDVNWAVNYVNAPVGALQSHFLAAAVDIVNSIRTNSGAQVFGWGGNWQSKKDWMHFEVICTGAEARSGFHR